MKSSIKSLAKEFRRKIFFPWLLGLIAAAAFCSGYLGMYAFRKAWQSHYPQLAGQWANNGRFAILGWYGTELSFEELAYADRVNNAARHWMAYDPYINDSRSFRQLLVDKLSYDSMAMLERVIGDINWTWIIARFLCCWAWFVLIYFLALRATESPPLAAFCAAFISCFSYILALLFVSDLQWSGGLLHAVAHDAWAILSYGRTEGVLRLHRPGVTYAYLFLGCLWLVKAAETRSWAWALASGVLGGLTAYVHLDTWTTYLGGAGIFWLLSWKDRRLFGRLGVSVALSTLLSLPFFLSNFPANRELVLRGVMTSQTAPSFDRFSVIYMLAALLVLKFRRKPVDRLLASLCLAVFAMTNIGFILGYQFEPSKWEYIGNIFLFLIAASWLPAQWKAARRPWHWACAALIVIALLQGLSYAAIHYPFQGLPKDYDGALNWLNRNTAADSEVLTLNAEIDTLIPAYTHDDVSLSFAAPILSDYPLVKNYGRLLGALRLLGVNEKKFAKDCVFNSQRYDRRGIVATGLYRGNIEKTEMHGILFAITPDWYVRKIVAQARPLDIHPDYIWFGDIEKQYAGKGFPSSKTWVEAYRNPSVTIYRRRTPDL